MNNYYYITYKLESTSTSYDAPSIMTNIHPREQTIYLQLINNNRKRKKKVTYLRIYKMENCLDVDSSL